MTDCKRRALEFVLLVGAMSFFAVGLAPAIVHAGASLRDGQSGARGAPGHSLAGDSAWQAYVAYQLTI